MSLFKIKTIWNATFPEEEFDQRHLAYGMINKLPAVVVGSYKGSLRVYQFDPKAKYVNGYFSLVYERQFDEPIIEVKFVSHPDESIRGNTLGVLLYKKFVYLSLQQQDKQSPMLTGQLMNVQVQPSFGIIPYPLSLTTLNFSIQSLNPKQLHPIKQSDSIYSYVCEQENMYYMDGEDLVKIKGNIEQWRIIVGRVRLLFLVGEVVVVVGEMNLWEVQQGKIIKCKRLEEEVSTAALTFKPNNDFNIIVCNFLTQLLIYSRNYELLWAVKLDYVPINIVVSDSQLLKGALIMLTDQGTLEIAYLGAEVQERELRPLDQQVSMERVQKQTAFYLQKLRQLKSGKNNQKQTQKITQSTSSFLTLKPVFSQPQQTSEFVDNSEQLYRSASNLLLKCTLNVDLVAQGTELTNVKVMLTKPSNLFCVKDEIEIDKLRGKEVVRFDCFVSKEKFPYQTTVKVTVRYEKGKSTLITSQLVNIPISFQCQIVSFESMESAEKKITFKCTDTPLPPFNTLFADVMERGCGQQKKAITFRLMNGVRSSIVYNKNLTKVKIESEVYSGLCFIFLQFITRIESHLSHQKQAINPVEVQVPLKELQQQIRDYYSFRESLRRQYSQLESRIDEFKKTQKKLLLKMKEKNSQIQHIHKLLEFTHTKVLQSAQKYEQLLEQTQIVNHNFEVSLKLVMCLVYKRSAASVKAIERAQSIIKFDAERENILDDEGWAERLAKSTAFYLNKKYEPTLQNLQKLVTWVITKVNNGQWN